MRTLLAVLCWALALGCIPFIEGPANGMTLLAFLLVAVGAAILWPESNDTHPGPRR